MDPTNPNPSAEPSGDKAFFPLSGKQPDPTPPVEPVSEPAPEPVEVTVTPAAPIVEPTPVEPTPVPTPEPAPAPEPTPAETPAAAVSEPTPDPLPNLEIPTSAVDLSGVNVENTVVTDDKKAPKPLTANFQSTDPAARPVAPITTKGAGKGGSKKNLIILIAVIIVIAIGAFVGMNYLPGILAGDPGGPGGSTTPPPVTPMDPTVELVMDLKDRFSAIRDINTATLDKIEDEDLNFTIIPDLVLVGIPDDDTLTYEKLLDECTGAECDAIKHPGNLNFLVAAYLKVSNGSTATRFATASLTASNGVDNCKTDYVEGNSFCITNGRPFDAICDEDQTEYATFCKEFGARFQDLLYTVDAGKNGEGWVFFTLEDADDNQQFGDIKLTYYRAETTALGSFTWDIQLTAPIIKVAPTPEK